MSDPHDLEQTAQASPYGASLKGRYRVERELGRGGLGVVYVARDEALHDRRVVVKMPLLPDDANRPWIAQKFADEVKALALIEHPGVVGALDSGVTDDGQPFLVMQYLEGRSLKSAIPAEGLPLDYAAHILREIGRALAAAHARNIWHRDLKPANVMLQRTADGGEYARLIDFGIASVRDSMSRSETRTGVAGTLPYMAPEQLEGRASAAADMWAFAVIAYELTTGRKPFVANDPLSLVRLQKAGVSVRPSQLRPDLPAAAERVMLQGLAFRPEDRPRSASEFGDELARLLVTAEPPVYERRRRGLIAAATVVLTIVVVSGAWWAMRDRSGTGAVGGSAQDGVRSQAADLPLAAEKKPAASEPAVPDESRNPSTTTPVPAMRAVAPPANRKSDAAKSEKSAAYSGPKQGRLVWTGDLQPGQEVDLGSKDIAASGALPGVPVSIELHPSSVTIVTPPSAANGWRRLVVRNDGKKQVVLLVTWTVLER